jgi:carboxyl-terminal processing protease
MKAWAWIALLALTARASAGQHLMDDARYWRATSLPLSYAQRFISNRRCYSNAKYLFSCIEAINSAGMFLDRPVKFIANDRIQPGEQVVHHYPALSVVSLISANKFPGESPRKRLRNERREREHLREATGRHFSATTSGTLQIDFNGLLAQIVGHLPPRVPPQMALGAAITGHLKLFDAHAAILPAANEDAQSAESARAFVGIGITFRAYPGGAVVENVFPGTPAYRVGLRRGDLIVQIIASQGDHPVPVAGKTPAAIVNLIGGIKNTLVELIVVRGRATLDFKVPRKQVNIPFVSTATIQAGPFKIGYFKIRSFLGSGVCETLRRQISQLETSRTLGAILDLRGNPGGYLSTAICVSSLFLGRQRVAGVKYVHVTVPGHTNDFIADADHPIDWLEGEIARPSKIPVVVLIDSQSASASEIVAGALQAYRRAWLVGERSYGKGSVQTTSPMDDNDTLDLTETTGRFYLPNGSSNEWIGVRPDFEVPYSTSAASPLDRFTPREEDDYPNGLAPTGEVQRELRPNARDKIRACVEANGGAGKIMRNISTTNAPADFQRAYAIGVLECSGPLRATR